MDSLADKLETPRSFSETVGTWNRLKEDAELYLSVKRATGWEGNFRFEGESEPELREFLYDLRVEPLLERYERYAASQFCLCLRPFVPPVLALKAESRLVKKYITDVFLQREISSVCDIWEAPYER